MRTYITYIHTYRQTDRHTWLKPFWLKPFGLNLVPYKARHRTHAIGAKASQLDSPPGLTKIKPLKRNKVQQEATELLATSWTTLPEETQVKLQALGIGPSKPEEPELNHLLKTHMDAGKLKGQVTELKNLSIRKNQLQVKIDGVKAQYAALLTEMQELQTKLADGQKALQKLSEDHMKAVNQTPPATELTEPAAETEQIPMAWASPSRKSRSLSSMGFSRGPIRTKWTSPPTPGHCG